MDCSALKTDLRDEITLSGLTGREAEKHLAQSFKNEHEQWGTCLLFSLLSFSGRLGIVDKDDRIAASCMGTTTQPIFDLFICFRLKPRKHYLWLCFYCDKTAGHRTTGI